MNKLFIGPVIAITTIIIGTVFLRDKPMPVLFDSIPLSNLIWILVVHILIVICFIIYARHDNKQKGGDAPTR